MGAVMRAAAGKSKGGEMTMTAHKIRKMPLQRGMSLAEVLIAVAITGVLIFATLAVTQAILRRTRMNMDKQFATQKAIAMLEELKSLVQVNSQSATLLDSYDNGELFSPLLTTLAGVTDPASTISGNQAAGTGWIYDRQISVSKLPGQSSIGVRLVRVRVYKYDQGQHRLVAEVASVIRTLATVMPPTEVYDVYAIAIENVPGWWTYTAQLRPLVTNAVNDLMARNPGLQFRIHWITELGYGRDQLYRPFINSTSDSDQDINSVYFYPGALSQSASGCSSTSTNTVDTCRNPPFLSEYYPVSAMKGHILIDTNDTNGTASSTPVTHPYAFADQYNHAMRYEDELALFNQRVSDGVERDPEAWTLRLLLDRMILDPRHFQNAIIVNLHGELLPFPPVRNYSDAAKDPGTTGPPNLSTIRVVTHPERLTYGQGEDVFLRVYGYKAYSGNAPNAMTFLPSTVPITVLIKNMTIGAGNIVVSSIHGGTVQGYGGGPPDTYGVDVPAANTVSGNKMYANVTTPGSDTLITLYNTPVVAPCSASPCVAASGGLPIQLYGMDYVPAPIEDLSSTTLTPASLGGLMDSPAFTTNLTTAGNTKAKNTARWVIQIKNAAFPANSNGLVKVETRLGSDLTAGTAANKPADLSTTYVYRGTKTWLYGDGTTTNVPHLPMTERYQFQGDPRHSPYADNKQPHVNWVSNSTGGYGGAFDAAATPGGHESYIGMGYNRYFDDLGGPAAAWPGWGPYNSAPTGATWSTTYGVTKGWAADGTYGLHESGAGLPYSATNNAFGTPDLDIHRLFQTWRAALSSARAVYTTMTGWTYYYIGIGGEIGYDRDNQFPSGIPLSRKPFNGTSGQLAREQSITNDRDWNDAGNCKDANGFYGVEGTDTGGCGVKYIRDGSANSYYWWGMPWLGELYPDSQWATWSTTGNLPTGTGANNFVRVLRQRVSPTVGGATGVVNIMPAGTALRQSTHRTNGGGVTTMMWSGIPTGTFHHYGGGGSASLFRTAGTPRPLGNEIDTQPSATPAIKGYNLPLFDPISAQRPYNLVDDNTWAAAGIIPDNPVHFLQPAYVPTHLFSGVMPNPAKTYANVLQNEGQFYLQGGNLASALISVREPLSNNVSFVIDNGLSPAGTSGQAFIARWSFLTLIHGFLTGGLYSDAGCGTPCNTQFIHQVPRVNITYPSVTDDLLDKDYLDITWNTTWKRWDGSDYTPSYTSATYTDGVGFNYFGMYSIDNGKTWRYMNTDNPATPGKPGTGSDIVPSSTSPLKIHWLTPAASFPQGTYIIRLECYRTDRDLHYSYHQFQAFMRRSS
jgi:prepilin-type N-terminal cleavage/methylation domain-containing protein